VSNTLRKLLNVLVTLKKLKKIAGDTNYKECIKDYGRYFNEKQCHNEVILIKKNTRKVIKRDINNSFNVEYLFCICKNHLPFF